MPTAEENALLTHTGLGTPGGDLLRRYWQPIALREELLAGGPPVPVRLLGEDLVLFRDERGRPGLLGIHCSHRGADLSYGRLEDGGLRCIYHGWLYDVGGRCLEQPGEPAGNIFHERIRQPAYPCVEKAGVILAYLGPGEPPLLPAYEFLGANDDHYVANKVWQDCNYLQGNEGNLDPAHLSFLHRLALEGDINQKINAQVTCPQIETEDTDFGVRIYAVRPLGPEKNYVRVTNFVMPNFSAVAGDAEGYSVNWHVPIDDTHHWRWGIRFNRVTPIDRRRWGATEMADGYQLIRKRDNRYLQDRDSMTTWAFSGLGKNFVVHDTCATEGEGPIYDRTQEHLAYTDRGIVAMRRVMLEAIREVQEGREPRHVIRDSAGNDRLDIFLRNDVLLPSSVDWHGYWRSDSVHKVLASTRDARRTAVVAE